MSRKLKFFKRIPKQGDPVLEQCEEKIMALEKFGLLILKNFKVQFRHQTRNFLELLLFFTCVMPLCLVLSPDRGLETHLPFEINSLDYLR